MRKQKIVIVDEFDTPIGSKYRDEVDYSKDIYRAAGVWIVNSKNEVLIAQRKLTKDKDPGMWGPAAAGTVEEGETYESNAYKEAEEELGLTGVAFELGPKQYSEHPRRYFGQWFICRIDKPVEDFVLQEEEVERVAWIDRATLERDVREYPEKYVPSLQKAITFLP